MRQARPSLSSLLVFTLSLLFLGCSEPVVETKTVIRPVKLLQVENHHNQQLREFPAKVQASDQAQISFRIPGQLIQFDVQPAQQVSKGQLLARLDDRDIRNELAVRQADYDLAKTEFQRIKKLKEQKLVPPSSFDSASAALKSAKAALRLTQDRLTYSELRAPFSGRIAQTLVENHQFVQAQQTLLVLQKDTTLDVSIQLPESILSNVRQEEVDQSYRPSVYFAGNREQQYQASYKEHKTSITPGTQSFEVIFSLPIPKQQTIYPGMGATLILDMAKILPGNQQQKGFVVPVAAVLKDDASGDNQVWRYNPQNGEVLPIKVSTGQISQKGIQILSGINTGDILVAAGLNQLQPGMKVKPLQRERGL